MEVGSSNAVYSPALTRSGTRFNSEDIGRLRHLQTTQIPPFRAPKPKPGFDLVAPGLPAPFPTDESQLLDSVTPPDSNAMSDMSHTPLVSEAGRGYPPLQHSLVAPQSSHANAFTPAAPLANSTVSSAPSSVSSPTSSAQTILPDIYSAASQVAIAKSELQSLLSEEQSSGVFTGPVSGIAVSPSNVHLPSVSTDLLTTEVPLLADSVPQT